jgi:hypothetical protein
MSYCSRFLGRPSSKWLLPLMLVFVVLSGTSSSRNVVAQSLEPDVASPESAASRESTGSGSTNDATDPAEGAPFTESLRIERIEIGLASTWKIGHWTPARITLASGSASVDGRLSLSLPDGDGFRVDFTSDPMGQAFELPAHSSQVLTTYIKIARPQSELEIVVQLPSGAELRRRLAVHEETTSLASTQDWILQIGGTIELDRFLRRRRSQTSDETHPTAVSDTRSLPSEWFGYEGVQTILLMTSDEAELEKLTDEQREALRQWVQLGGRLLFSSGRQAAQIYEAGGPLAELIPGQISETAEQSVAAGLEAFARADQPLGAFVASVLSEPRGRIEAHMEGRAQARQPAIVRAPHGFGQVVFLAFDIDRSPFLEWGATEELLRTILLGSPQSREGAMRDEGSRRVTHFGYDELSGQLRSALDSFPALKGQTGVRLVSFFAVAGILACYVVCISAGDYFLLQRVFGRMIWTWLTFPVFVVAFSVGIVLLGEGGRTGPALRLNQADVVDVDLVEGTVRGTSWAHLYGSTTRGHDLSVEPVWSGLNSRLGDVTPSFRAATTWQGLPGRGLGGMDQTASETQFTVSYQIRSDGPSVPETLLLGMPITSGSTRSLLTRWWSFPSFPKSEPLTADRDGFLHGTIVNPFDFPLEDALLAYDRWSYRIDRPLQPGESLFVDGLQRRDLEWRLTRRRALHGKTSYTSTPWETDSRDVERIVEMMMFHEAAGGRGYTDLNQQYQGYMDLSEHLFLGRAVFVGRVAQPGVQLKAGEQPLTEQADRSWTWYRLILPVEYSATMATERYLP